METALSADLCRRARRHGGNLKDHTQKLFSEREMEFSFISSSLKLPFTPRPRLSQRRSPVTTELKYQVRVPKRWQGICCSSFLALRSHIQYQCSEEPLANCWKCLLGQSVAIS